MVYVLLLFQVLGVITSVNALMSTRTSQGAIAWIVSLNAMPLLAVPAYWVFGRNKFQGYVSTRKDLEEKNIKRLDEVRAAAEQYVVRYTDPGSGARAIRKLAKMPWLRGNKVELLVNGQATFDSILAGLAQARKDILFQFYIVRDDQIGRAIADVLIERASNGVRVCFLYDELGSKSLPDSYIDRLEEAGVRVYPFHSTRGSGNKFQLNFRNHRKVVVVDGKAAWVGGLNVGDEYLGRDPKFPNWRDTHMKIEGPAALELQLCFSEDWRWATDEELELEWPVHSPQGSDATVLILPSGPADRLETASLMYQQAIHAAQERIWISTPYFVPDLAVKSALHLAVLRGVDVRILIPEQSDSKLIYYSTWAFAGALLRSGVRMFRYQPGFTHQKVFLVDDQVAGVGTANFDNRSFRLNFEVTALVQDPGFLREMERMFESDLAESHEMTADDVDAKSMAFKLLARAAYLTAPIQ